MLRVIKSFGAPRRPIRRVVASPEGHHVVLTFGDDRTWVSPVRSGLALFRLTEGAVLPLGEIPVDGDPVFALDDGHTVVVQASYQQVLLTRLRPESGGIALEERVTALSGLGLGSI